MFPTLACTSQEESVSSQTVALVGPTWRRSGPRTSSGTAARISEPGLRDGSRMSQNRPMVHDRWISSASDHAPGLIDALRLFVKQLLTLPRDVRGRVHPQRPLMYSRGGMKKASP